MGIFSRKSSTPASGSFSEIVTRMRSDYEAGRLNEVYKTAKKYDEIAFEYRETSESEWFWFNAYAALAGLKSKRSLMGDIAGWCGFATTSGFGDPAMKAVKDEILRLAEPYRI
jgi:hypothetical protein